MYSVCSPLKQLGPQGTFLPQWNHWHQCHKSHSCFKALKHIPMPMFKNTFCTSAQNINFCTSAENTHFFTNAQAHIPAPLLQSHFHPLFQHTPFCPNKRNGNIKGQFLYFFLVFNCLSTFTRSSLPHFIHHLVPTDLSTYWSRGVLPLPPSSNGWDLYLK